jgi:hypothetical protein
MARSDDDVFHAGGFRDIDPRVGVELHRVELWGQLLVFRGRDVFLQHDPLGPGGAGAAWPLAGGHGVESPVDEHSEAGIGEPRHALLLFGVERLHRRLSAWRGLGAE